VTGLCPSHTTLVISNVVRNLLFVNRESPKEAKPGKRKGKSRFLGFRLGMTIYLTHPSVVDGLYPSLVRDGDRTLQAGALIIRERLRVVRFAFVMWLRGSLSRLTEPGQEIAYEFEAGSSDCT
jgi:hypothetical protein